MGRGSGEHRDDVASPSAPSSLDREVTARIKGYSQLRVVKSGTLSAPAAGQPPGTAYVVIQADNAMNRDIAKDLLREHCGTTDLAWEYGWTMRPRPGRGSGHFSELTLYAVPSGSSAWQGPGVA